MQVKTAFVILAALASAAAMGCSTSSSGNVSGPAAATRASLHRAKTCNDLLGDLKGDASYKLSHAIDQQIQGIVACQKAYPDTQCAYYGGYLSNGFGGGGAEKAVDSASAAPTASDSSNASASSFSHTNTQVKGVDEADIVKNDGKNLYVLHGKSFKVINAWPAADLKEAGSIDLEGDPLEMFVDDGKVVVYSQVNGAAVFAAAGVTPKAQYTDYGYGVAYAGGGASGGDEIAPGVPTNIGGSTTPQIYVPLTKVTVMALDGSTPRVTREVYFEGSYLDARRVGPHVRTVFQGFQYGPKLKYGVYELYPTPAVDPNGATTVDTNPYPKTGTEMIAALEKLRADNSATIAASQLNDWLPYTFVKNGAAVSAQTVACEDFYVPTVGSTESGLTEVASLDLSDPTATPKQSAILGRVDTVYGNADTLYLAARAWVQPPFMWNDPTGTGTVGVGGTAGTTTPAGPPETAPTPAPPSGKQIGLDLGVHTQTAPTDPNAGVVVWSSSNTHIHKFEFTSQPDFPNYVASGTVTGAIKDQFSLDEKDGFLRVATTENRQYVTSDGKYVTADPPVAVSSPSTGVDGKPEPTAPTAPPVRPNTVNHVFVLENKGPWLEATGDVGDLAPNEQIYSVRFVESRGYVVTFRQVDPLFVIDLAAPAAPRVLAALTIPGFSEYMHPLDANHLLTIGRDTSVGGRAQALQLQIFDVTDGAHPVVQQRFTYDGSEYGGASDAEYDHKAFTYFEDKNLLAFPYYSYGGGIDGAMRSTLELFHVDIGAGFTKLGSIDHTPLVKTAPQGYCGGYFGPTVRRGVFLENFVYSVSYGGVVAKDANNLAATGAELSLPNPLVNQGYGPVACY